MVAQSVLRVAQTGYRKLPPQITRNSVRLLEGNQQFLVGQSVRNAGHARKIEILPSRFEWEKFKDHSHFYFWLAAIPLGLVTAFSNLFVGSAELVEIPEDYEPKHWEYYKHPVSRFFSKYCHDSFQKTYERNLHYIAQEQEKIKMRKLEDKVKDVMREKTDYKAWYYVPFNSGHIYQSYNERQREIKEDGGPM